VLRLTSLQAPLADPFCRKLAAYLGRRLDRRTEFVDDEPWQERERRLDRGEIHVAWICGLPYVRRAESVTLLAAPIMAAPRYGGRPVYFSDVVVRSDSPYDKFTDLEGTRWAFNERGSHSGYGVTRYELARAGLGGDFFGEVVEAGHHHAALDLLLRGQVDATALDSTVLEAIRATRPELEGELRVIATWGPSPMPPWVAASHVDAETRRSVRGALVAMHLDPEGGEILAGERIAGFAALEDDDYDPIRAMAREGQSVRLQGAGSPLD